MYRLHRIYGANIDTDEEARCFQEGVTGSKALKVIQYSTIFLVPCFSMLLYSVFSCNDRTESQTFFAKLLKTNTEITVLKLVCFKTTNLGALFRYDL